MWSTLILEGGLRICGLVFRLIALGVYCKLLTMLCDGGCWILQRWL